MRTGATFAEWEVRQLAIQIYVAYQSNPRRSETNTELAKKAVQAAIDFQIAWGNYHELKRQAAL